MSSVETDVHDSICWVTFNRPRVANAVDEDWLRAMGSALNYAQHPRNNIRCLVLTGAGKHFCGGIDLKSMVVRRYFDHLIERLLAFRVPIVAAVNGAAAGSGVTLALTADVIVMAADAYLLPSFAKIGVLPDNAITHLLTERIGASTTRAVLMLSDRIEARRAHEWGLAYDVVSRDDLHARAEEFATRLVAGPQRVLGMTRALLNRAEQAQMRKQGLAERHAHTNDFLELESAEGRAAFLEHREPHF